MSAGSSGARRIALLLRPSTIDSKVCRSCQEILFIRRSYATAAAVSQSPLPTTTSEPPLTTTPTTQPIYNINAGIVLSRPPQVTRDLPAFEKAFYFYQRRLNERLVLPFTRYFYFKRGTVGDVEWKAKYKLRNTAARDIGGYNAYTKDAWNDELLLGAPESEPEHQVEELVRDAETDETGNKVHNVLRPRSRVTEADVKSDFKSLDRLLPRTLYLLVQGQEGVWKFPAMKVQQGESLREAADRSLALSAGVNMNTWTVGYHPIGHYSYEHRKPRDGVTPGTQIVGEKTFFLKARIMAGQADLKAGDATLGLKDFKWLSKEEIEKVVTPMYWRQIRNMLADR